MEVDYDQRVAWINLLQNSLKNNIFFKKTNLDSFYVSRRLEEFCHRNRQQKIIINDIPIYKYGEKKIIFEDKDAHIEAFKLQYIETIKKMCFICAQGNIDNVKYETPENWLENDKIIEGTKHDIWEKQYYDRQETAKNVLNKENTKGLFSCPKCKSFDVDTDQKQTRSSDEPMTIFCSCNACGKRFIR